MLPSVTTSFGSGSTTYRSSRTTPLPASESSTSLTDVELRSIDNSVDFTLGNYDRAIETLFEGAALAVIVLIFNVIGFFAEPIGNGFSRMQEHAADLYGLEVTHGIIPNSNEAAAHAFQVMGELDLADPNPSRFITIWLYSHPPLADRLKFAQEYDPWGKGEATKYLK